MSRKSFSDRARLAGFAVALGVLLIGCSNTKLKEFLSSDIDPRAGLSKDQYMDSLSPENKENKKNKDEKKEGGDSSKRDESSDEGPAIPKMSEIVIAPRRPGLAEDKALSFQTFQTTENVPLKDLFVELARKAEINLQLDPEIKGGVLYSAKNKPFSEVVSEICDLAGLRYSMENGILRVERDLPYVKNYQVAFFAGKRKTEAKISVDTTSLTAQATGGGSSGGGSSGGSSSGGSSGGPTTGSSTKIDSSNDFDIWSTVEAGIKQIIGTGKDGGSAAAATPAAGQPSGATGAATSTETEAGQGKSFVAINREVGLITVSATSRQHKAVEEYINRIKNLSSAQVLIEAKVVEVTLKDQFSSGVNFSEFRIGGTKLQANGFSSSAGQEVSEDTKADFTKIDIGPINLGDVSVDQLVNFTQKFGVVRTLSSPRILAVNNQHAVITFTKNVVSFSTKVENSTYTGNGIVSKYVSVNSTPRTTPEGVMLTVLPSVDSANNEIMMNVRPTLSRIVSYVKDPTNALTSILNGVSINEDADNLVPQVEVREMDSLLKIKSGQVMAIGGLMEDRVSNTDSGMPFISDIPIIGNAFKGTGRNTKLVQTVIFIKATIMPSYGVDKEDKEFYKKFTTDPRPYSF